MQPSVEQLLEQTLGVYHVEQLLGRGNVNAVYIARHQERGEMVMLTVLLLPPEFSVGARERYLRRFEQVAADLKTLDHPHILPVLAAGEQMGYPYMVTPLVTSGSLARLLKQQGRVSPTQALTLLKQVTSALEHAQARGISHGTLKPVNMLLDEALAVRIAGFGMARILEMRGIEPVDEPYGHLYSVARTFLGAPEYIAPEVVQGEPVDARADIYSLGIILFEMLTGRVPFSGADPLSTALMHVQQQVPAIHSVNPEIPAALDLVVQRAVERDPAKRYQTAGQLAYTFERVMQFLEKAGAPATPSGEPQADRDKTLPPVVSFFSGIPGENELSSLSHSQRLKAVNEMGNWQIRPPIVTGNLPAVKPTASPQTSLRRAAMATTPLSKEPFAETAIDPFVWASTASVLATRPLEKDGTGLPGTFEARPPRRGQATKPLSGKRAPDRGRRRTVALIAGGGMVAAGLLGVGGFTLAHLLQPGLKTQVAHQQPASPTTATTPAATKQATTAPSTHATKKNNAKQAAAQHAQPTQAAQPTQPPQPTPTAPKPTHTGTVIGSSNQASGSASGFTNPADGKASLLVRLAGGNFVAYERACTHEGVPVNYDPASGHLICPRHFAVFDPANGSVLKGPAQAPLPPVAVRVNADGTVTTG